MKKAASILVFLMILSCTQENPGTQEQANVFSVSASSTRSGSSVQLAVDANEATAWYPDGNPVEEGINIRFLTAMQVETLEIKTPDGKGSFEIYINGQSLGQVKPAAPIKINQNVVYTVYIKIVSSDTSGITDIIINKDSTDNRVIYPQQLSGSVTASSSLTPEQSYSPDLMFDGRLDFGWAEGAKGQGEGEKCSISFSAPVQLDQLYIANGYQRSPDHFKKNSRIKTLEISADGKMLGEFNLKDSEGIQIVSLNSTVKVSYLTFTIKNVYPGSQYQDTLISELKLGYKGRIYNLRTDYEDRMAQQLASSLAGNFLGSVVGRQLVADTEESSTTLKLRKNGSFVVWHTRTQVDYAEDSEVRLEQTQVMDGNWVLASAGDLSAVKIFGRDHLVNQTQEKSYNPYDDSSSSSTSEVTRIFSDNLNMEKLPDGRISIAGKYFNADFEVR